MRYEPAITPVTRKFPQLFDETDCTAVPDKFSRVTVASATGCPSESHTDPVTIPAALWPQISDGASRSQKAATNTTHVSLI
jgi:hypothetical protein